MITQDDNTNETAHKKHIRSTRFTPPELEEFKAYCVEKGYGKIAQKAYDYYHEANWHDSQGRPVKNWKQKLIAVWFKEENKQLTPQQDVERVRKLMKDLGHNEF